MTDGQKSSFSKYYKQANAGVAKLITTSSYLKQDETKAKSIKKAYDLYYKFAKAKALKSATSSKLGALLTATGGDCDVATAASLIILSSELDPCAKIFTEAPLYLQRLNCGASFFLSPPTFAERYPHER